MDLDLEAILGTVGEELPEGFRSGLVCFVGRPNVGKSTLMNALLGQKVSIVTDVPGTTRNAIRGVLDRPDAQVVVIDTPGVAKPKTLLTRRLNELVRETWGTVDVVCLLVDGHDGIGAGDRYLAEQLVGVKTPVVVVVTKEDLIREKRDMVPILAAAAELVPGAEVIPTAVPLSAQAPAGPPSEEEVLVPPRTLNLDRLVDVLVGHLREGPRFFPAGTLSDQPERQLVAEILREKLIGQMQEELPHSIAVTVDELEVAEHRDDLLEIHAVIHVERDSQKGIVIGKKGAVLKAAATAARQDLEAILGTKVYLTTHVKIAKEWQRDPKQLRRLGY